MQDVNYRGKAVYFAGKDHIVPSLSVAQFEDSFETLTQIAPVTDLESLKKQFATLLPIIGAALRRNYPELKDEHLRDHLDLRTFKECLSAVQNTSGLKEAAPGEA